MSLIFLFSFFFFIPLLFGSGRKFQCEGVEEADCEGAWAKDFDDSEADQSGSPRAEGERYCVLCFLFQILWQGGN